MTRRIDPMWFVVAVMPEHVARRIREAALRGDAAIVYALASEWNI